MSPSSGSPASAAALPLGELILWCAVPAIAFATLYEYSAWRAAGTLGFPLDDAWIHAQFARNIATGHGFSFTGDRWVAGSTSPLWTLLLAAGYLVLRSVLISAKLFGLALQIVSGVLAARLVQLLTDSRDLAIAGALLAIVCPAMVWGAVSGMELGLASALVLAGFVASLDASRGTRGELTGIACFAAACLARPETLVILGLAGIRLLLRARGIAPMARRAAIAAAIVIAILGPFVVLDYATTGKPLPTTFYAKSGPGLMRAIGQRDPALAERLFTVMGPEAVRQMWMTLREQFGLAAFAVPIGFVASFAPRLRRRGAPLLFLVVLAAAYSMGLIAPQRLKPENFRYTAQLVVVLAAGSIASLAAWPPLQRIRPARVALAAALLAGAAWQAVQAAPVYATSVRNIEQLQVATGKWLRGSLPPAARVAVNDIGAIAFFSRHEVIDLEGLVSPEALAYPRPSRGIGFVEATHPDFIAIFPFWYLDISSRTDLFQEVHRISIQGNVASAGDTIVIYRTPWTREAPFAHPFPVKPRLWPE